MANSQDMSGLTGPKLNVPVYVTIVPDQYASNRIIYTLPVNRLITGDNMNKGFIRLVSIKKVKEANDYG
jgi:hypothetical protein